MIFIRNNSALTEDRVALDLNSLILYYVAAKHIPTIKKKSKTSGITFLINVNFSKG